jgi:hypothetical protein
MGLSNEGNPRVEVVLVRMGLLNEGNVIDQTGFVELGTLDAESAAMKDVGKGLV